MAQVDCVALGPQRDPKTERFVSCCELYSTSLSRVPTLFIRCANAVHAVSCFVTASDICRFRTDRVELATVAMCASWTWYGACEGESTGTWGASRGGG
eukprot:7442515-Pyramimonas_sp.AAC.1